MQRRLKDRAEAGRLLAEKLIAYADRSDVLVLALPRGGVPVAYEIARRLNAPLDAFIVRKLGTPLNEEMAMGAIATGGVRVLNEEVIETLRISAEEIEAVERKERKELERRERVYRSSRPAPDVRGRTVILVDNGVATGTTMLAAIAALRKCEPARIIVSVAVASISTYLELRHKADDAVCLMMPEEFYAVSQWYEHFTQVTDKEVRDLLERASPNQPALAG